MAYHKLPDVQHAMRWMEVVLGESGSCNGEIEKLRNGVLFCRLVSGLLDRCVDLSQVRKQGNPEMITLHNLALLNKSLMRYNIIVPSRLQAAFESIGQKRSSTQHIVNLLMWIFEYFTGSKSGHSPSSPDQYVLFCSRQFLFHGVGSLQSTPREAGEEPPLQQQLLQQQQQYATQLKQHPPSESFVDLTRPLKNGRQPKAEETRRQSSQQQASVSFESTKANVEVASSQLMFEKRDAETSTSAVLNYAASLESSGSSLQTSEQTLSEALTANEEELFLSFEQALDESDRIALDDSFGFISGILTKYGLGSYSQPLEHSSVKEISSAMIKEICEQEEEEQGLALQRNREAREALTDTRCLLRQFAALFGVGYRKINEAQASALLRPSQLSKSGKQQRDLKEKVDNAELDWKLCHSNFSEIILQMQQLMRLISESHVSQQLAAHRCVQKEKIMRILAEAQLQERDEMHAAHAEAYKLLDQRHEDLRERYIELCSSMNMQPRVFQESLPLQQSVTAGTVGPLSSQQRLQSKQIGVANASTGDLLQENSPSSAGSWKPGPPVIPRFVSGRGADSNHAGGL